MKPPKYDETGSFETFLVAQIQNYVSYNKKEQLIYLRSSLEKYAGQVLWDYSSETTTYPSKMIKILKERFGEANQSDNYRFELDHSARERMACGSFIDALNDPHFGLKVRAKCVSAFRKTLTLVYELHFNWKYGLRMPIRSI